MNQPPSLGKCIVPVSLDQRTVEMILRTAEDASRVGTVGPIVSINDPVEMAYEPGSSR